MIGHMQRLQRSRLEALHGFPCSGSAFRCALASQQQDCSSPHVGRHLRSPGVPVGTAARSQLHRYAAPSLHRYTVLKAQPERSPDYSNSGLELDIKIGRVEVQIEAVGKEVEKAELAVQEIQVALRDLQAKLASSSSPVLNKKEQDALLMLQQQLLTDLQYERMKEQQLRTKEQHLRTEKQQLRTEKQQLRTEKQQLREEKRELREEQRELTGKLGGPATPDWDGTAMMARIRELKGEVPAPGEVLSFSGFTSSLLLDAYQNSVYIRGCYKPLFEALLKVKSKDAIITGTPGIGKSYFLYYLLTRLLALPEPPPYILLEHFGGQVEMWCYDHATGEVLAGTRAAFTKQLREPKAWYICDGLEPILILKARILLLSSPCRSRYKELQKVGAETLYMPLWTLEELLDCRAKVFGSTVPKELAMQLYERFGGVARYVLCLPSRQGTDDPAARLKKLEEVLEAALRTCDISQVGRGIGALETGPEVSHRVVHINTKGQDSFELSHLGFASEWVEDTYFELSSYSDIRKLAGLLEGTTGAMRGTAHEQLEHQLLPMGGDYTIQPIDGVTLARGKEDEELWLPAASEVRRFQDVHEIMDDSGCLQEEVYCWPRNKNFPAVDSLLRVGKTLHLFQMTVSSTDKKVSADGLTKLYESLGATDKRYEHLNLYFVVPRDVFKSFKLGPALKSWPPTDKQPDALRTRLYVLKGGKRGQTT